MVKNGELNGGGGGGRSGIRSTRASCYRCEGLYTAHTDVDKEDYFAKCALSVDTDMLPESHRGAEGLTATK